MAKKKLDTSSESALSVVIDRIEEDRAVMTLSDNDKVHFELPQALLPADAKAGDWLKVTFALDSESTAATSKRVAALQADLTKDNDPEQMNIKL